MKLDQTSAKFLNYNFSGINCQTELKQKIVYFEKKVIKNKNITDSDVPISKFLSMLIEIPILEINRGPIRIPIL